MTYFCTSLVTVTVGSAITASARGWHPSPCRVAPRTSSVAYCCFLFPYTANELLSQQSSWFSSNGFVENLSICNLLGTLAARVTKLLSFKRERLQNNC